MSLFRFILPLLLLAAVRVVAYGTADDEFKRISELKDQLAEQKSLSLFFQLLNGLKADDFVPGSINCSLDIIASQIDINSVVEYFSPENDDKRPEDAKNRLEEAIFKVLRELT